MSGFTQETYGITHAGGDVDEVKRNMETLADLHEDVGSRTAIEVLYHRYALLRYYAKPPGYVDWI